MWLLLDNQLKNTIDRKYALKNISISRWQNTVERIQNSAKKRKQIKKRLEEDEVEDISQLTYRGLKRQGAIGEDVNN